MTVLAAGTPPPTSGAAVRFPIARTCPFAVPETYLRLQRDEPVSRVEMSDGSRAWLLTRHADVRAVLVDPRFSSERTHPGFPAISGGGKQAFTHFAPFLISLDGAAHAAARGPLITEFSMRGVARFRPRIEALVGEAVERLAGLPQPVDLVSEFAALVPSRIVRELVGAGAEHVERFYRLAGQMLARETTAAERDAAARGMRENMDDLVAAKLDTPGDDLLSREIARQRAEGRAIDRPGLASLAQLLLLAGHESTAEVIALGVVVLLTHPDQLAELRADPTLWPGAVEELLRFLSVVTIGMSRVCVKDAEIGGVLIRAGEGVIASNVAANRDPDVFVDAERFDIRRDARPHVAQGHGAHQCLGRNLARVELVTVFRELFDRFPDLQLAVDADELPYKYDALVYGLRCLPVTW